MSWRLCEQVDLLKTINEDILWDQLDTMLRNVSIQRTWSDWFPWRRTREPSGSRRSGFTIESLYRGSILLRPLGSVSKISFSCCDQKRLQTLTFGVLAGNASNDQLQTNSRLWPGTVTVVQDSIVSAFKVCSVFIWKENLINIFLAIKFTTQHHLYQ